MLACWSSEQQEELADTLSRLARALLDDPGDAKLTAPPPTVAPPRD